MIHTIANLWVERIEPLVYAFRRKRRLRMFGLEDASGLTAVLLDFAEPCTAGRLCTRLVRLYRRYYGRYARKAADRRGGVAAVLPLADFASYAAYQAELRKRSGYFARRARKAADAGYTVDVFHRTNLAPDILAIRKSMKFRAFGPVLDAFFLTLKRLGGAPARWRPLKPVDCAAHWEVCLGVFIHRPGHTQGEFVIDRQMVAYARLHRVGNVVRYADFMGHADHLANGVMHLLQMETVRWLMRAGDPAVAGIRYLTYGAIEQGSEGLLFWKRKALFRPMLLEMPD
jgi:hypothetical protein